MRSPLEPVTDSSDARRWHLGWVLTFLFGCALFLAWALRGVAAAEKPLTVFALLVLAPAIPVMPLMERLGLVQMGFISFPNALGMTLVLSFEIAALWVAGLGISVALWWRPVLPISRRSRGALAVWALPFACFIALVLFNRAMARQAIRQAGPLPQPPSVVREVRVQPRDSTGADIEAWIAPDQRGKLATLSVSDGDSPPLFIESRRIASSPERWKVDYGPILAGWRKSAIRSPAEPVYAEITFRVTLAVRSLPDSMRIGTGFAALPLNFEARADGFTLRPLTEHVRVRR